MRRLIISLGLAAALPLTACGSSHHAATTTSARAASTPPPTATAPPTATSPSSSAAKLPAGCTSVPAAKTYPSREHESKPTTKLDPAKTWVVTLHTNCGPIGIELAVKDSPKTSASFAGLVKRGFFDGLSFHRIASQPDGTPFVIQGGDPEGTGLGGPGYEVVEPPPASLHYTPGVVAMAKTSTDPSGASGSQFFIVDGPDEGLPAQYALLGHIVSGMANVDRIGKVPADPTTGMPSAPVVISHATLSSH